VDNGISELANVTKSSNPPNSPNEGDLWFDSDTNELFIYDSIYWVEVSGAAANLSEYLTIASASTTYATQIDLDNIDLSLYATTASIPGIIEQNTINPLIFVGT
jgi:hypothetical protein